jgi:hypothetical protein
LLVFIQHRRRRAFLLAGSIINWAGVLFFVVGANTLIDLVEFIQPEWVTWNVLGLIIPIIAGAFLFIAYLLDMKYSPKEEETAEVIETVAPEEGDIKFDISTAMDEEEAEEDEVFECPQCGMEFTEMIAVCPQCGAEFEGIEEEEVEDEGMEEAYPEEGEEDLDQDFSEEQDRE